MCRKHRNIRRETSRGCDASDEPTLIPRVAAVFVLLWRVIRETGWPAMKGRRELVQLERVGRVWEKPPNVDDQPLRPFMAG
ncbi:MAG TPA: hypothetical protein DIT13_17510 [Verrucomicrobiales bacterium]|nr:hypothetical protein [Verrucomicrobiales bacterium]